MASSDHASDDLAVLASIVASAAPLPSIESAFPLIAAWGTNTDSQGLAYFSRESSRLTALNWRAAFFHGSLGFEPLVARFPPHASTFICSSRMDALIELAPRLVQLDAGTLRGRRNCFALIGSRQMGKTTFMRGLAHAVARGASPRTVTISINFTEDGVQEPLHLLQRALSVATSGVTLSAELLKPTASIKGVLECMLSHRVGAFLCIDDVEALYRRPLNCELAARVFQQLRVLGSMDGPRPVVVVLTGSAAVLRVLLFAIDTPDHASIVRRYPCHLGFGSFNDHKFVPLTLAPIVAWGDLADAALCIISSFPQDRHRLETAGSIAKATSVVASSSAAMTAESEVDVCCVARGYTITPAYVAWLASRCRGLAGWIVDAVRNQMTRSHHLNRLLGTNGGTRAARIVPLERLLSAWEASVTRAGRDIATTASDATDESICTFGMPIDDAEPAGPWYDLADAGVLRFEGDSRPRRVHFLHPSDAGTVLMALRGGAATDSESMTPAEMLSLLAPQLASADEVNERLVMEALSWASQRSEGLRMRGRNCVGTFRGVGHSAEYLTVREAGAVRLLTVSELLPLARRNLLFKEFPDEQGSDGIGLVQGRLLTCSEPCGDDGGLPEAGDVPAAIETSDDHSCDISAVAATSDSASFHDSPAAAAAAVDSLWRVQVKMSSRLGATGVSGPQVIKWMQKMSESSRELLRLLARRPAVGCQCTVVHVLWCAQRLTGPALSVLRAIPSQPDTEQAATDERANAGHKRRRAAGSSSSFAMDCASTAGLGHSGDPFVSPDETPGFFLLVDASNMLGLWSPRVRAFVTERGLQQYGAPAIAGDVSLSLT